MHSVLYVFPSRVFFLWFIQKFDDFCYLLPGIEVGKLAGAARTEALLELGTPVDPSHQPVERLKTQANSDLRAFSQLTFHLYISAHHIYNILFPSTSAS